jgi:GTP-binding protein
MTDTPATTAPKAPARNPLTPEGRIALPATFVIGAASAKQFPDDGLPQVAFAGRSNVGKSTLQNTLLNRKGLVRTSSTPGRTREINVFKVGGIGYFVDLPGFGYARGGEKASDAFAKLVGEYLSQEGQPSLLVYLVDARVPDSEIDRICLGRILEAGVPVQVVVHKVDQVNQAQKHVCRQAIRALGDEGIPILEVSSLKGIGIPQLARTVLHALGAELPG